MDKQEHIEYWLKTAEEDWLTLEALFQAGRFVHCLFWAHLVLEKLSKALWVKANESNTPPKIHNIVYLLEKANVKMSNEQKDFLLEMNDLQLEGRYPDYLQQIYKRFDKYGTNEMLLQIKEIHKWLLSLL